MSTARKSNASDALSRDEVRRQRRQLVIGTAKTAGLLDGDNGRIAGRVRENLIGAGHQALVATGPVAGAHVVEYV